MAEAVRGEPVGGAYPYRWSLSQADGTGEAVSPPGGSDKTIHFFGNFSGTPTVVFEGTNEAAGATGWAILHDLTGAEISTSSTLIAAVAENPLHVRARLSSGGDGSTAVTAALLARKP